MIAQIREWIQESIEYWIEPLMMLIAGLFLMFMMWATIQGQNNRYRERVMEQERMQQETRNGSEKGIDCN